MPLHFLARFTPAPVNQNGHSSHPSTMLAQADFRQDPRHQMTSSKSSRGRTKGTTDQSACRKLVQNDQSEWSNLVVLDRNIPYLGAKALLFMCGNLNKRGGATKIYTQACKASLLMAKLCSSSQKGLLSAICSFMFENLHGLAALSPVLSACSVRWLCVCACMVGKAKRIILLDEERTLKSCPCPVKI